MARKLQAKDGVRPNTVTLFVSGSDEHGFAQAKDGVRPNTVTLFVSDEHGFAAYQHSPSAIDPQSRHRVSAAF